MTRLRGLVVLLAECVLLGSCSTPPAAAQPVRALHATVAQPSAVVWSEKFNRTLLGWITPVGSQAEQVPRVYSVQEERGRFFLHALHDARPEAGSPPPAIHFGKSFADSPVDLARVGQLRWRWRVHRHPASTADPWSDTAASVYVVTRTPGILPGRGFKFAWVSAAAPEHTTQHGLVQVALRTGQPVDTWEQESVDLCAMYRQAFGPCEGQSILYIGVVTDADNTKSVAEGDYADFELELTSRPAER